MLTDNIVYSPLIGEADKLEQDSHPFPQTDANKVNEEERGCQNTNVRRESIASTSEKSRPLMVQIIYFTAMTLAFIAFFFSVYVSVCAVAHTSAYDNYSGPADFVYNNNPLLGGGYSDDTHQSTAPQGKMLETFKAQGLGTEQEPIRISLVGDSMIANPWYNNDLESKLLSRLKDVTGMSFKFIMNAHYGQKIKETTENLPQNLQDDNSTVVILNHDSDATDTDTQNMTDNEYTLFLQQFSDQLSEFARIATSNTQVKFVAIAGPNVFGEGPLFKPARFTADKPKVLKDIRAVSMDVAKKFLIPYIDMKGALASVKPSWYIPYRYWCTRDGEHFNEVGTNIEADNFVYFLSL